MNKVVCLITLLFLASMAHADEEAGKALCIDEIKKGLQKPESLTITRSYAKERENGYVYVIVDYTTINGLNQTTMQKTKCIVDSSGTASLIY